MTSHSKVTSGGADRLAAYAQARKSRTVTLDAAQLALSDAVDQIWWDDVETLRNAVIPLFDALMRRMKQMGAAAACDLWDAFVPGWPAEMVIVEEPDRAERLVRAAARLIDVDAHDCSSFVGELQRQLQIIYDESKAVCMDGQE